MSADGSHLVGSMVWAIDKFIVLEGRWVEPVKEKLTTLIEEEFGYPYFEFVYGEYGDLGHGWSRDMLR